MISQNPIELLLVAVFLYLLIGLKFYLDLKRKTGTDRLDLILLVTWPMVVFFYIISKIG